MANGAAAREAGGDRMRSHAGSRPFAANACACIGIRRMPIRYLPRTEAPPDTPATPSPLHRELIAYAQRASAQTMQI
ncbi:hypothetical protein WL93_02680 [Burkholderia diffusa]|nr:hypothetical protein WL93_02680 [Burkholderia diffusa]